MLSASVPVVSGTVVSAGVSGAAVSGAAEAADAAVVSAAETGAAAAAVAGLALTAVLLVALLPVPPSMCGLWEAHEVLNFRPDPSYGSERIGIWGVTMGLIGEHPVFGIGFGNFQDEAMRRIAARGPRLAQVFDNPHCLPLEIAVTAGIPALLLFLALAVSLLRRCVRARELTLALCLLCWLTQSCFTFSVCITSPIAWAVFGMIAAAPGPAEQRRLS